MKKIVALLLVVAVVLGCGVVALAADASSAKNSLCIKGNVEFKDETKLVLTMEDEEGRTMYYTEFNVVNEDGSYTINVKYNGDITQRIIKLKYNGDDVTSGIESVTSVTDLQKVTVEDGVVNADDKYFYEDGKTLLAISYDEDGKLVKVQPSKDGSDLELSENTKVYCWNAMDDVLKYGKALASLMPKVDVFCIGDSYGQTWPEKWYPESGWGAHIGDYFNDRVTTANFCTSGGWAQAIMSNTQDAKYQQNIADGKKGTEGMYGWDDWKDMEKSNRYSKGDYVIVSLGLNDSSKYGPDGMEPVEWYGMALEEMAKRAKEKGVNLILCSPLHRATLKVDQTTKMFAAKTEEIAKKYGVVYINAFDALNKQYNKEFKTDDEVLRKYYLHREELLKPVEQGGWGLTQEQIENHGQESMRPSGSGKNAHPNINGADNFARTMIELIKQTDAGLKDYIK